MDIMRISPVVPMIRAHKYDANEQRKRQEKEKEREKEKEKEKNSFKKTLEYVKYIH